MKTPLHCPVPVSRDPDLGTWHLTHPTVGEQTSSTCGCPVSVADGQGLGRSCRWAMACKPQTVPFSLFPAKLPGFLTVIFFFFFAKLFKNTHPAQGGSEVTGTLNS